MSGNLSAAGLRVLGPGQLSSRAGSRRTVNGRLRAEVINEPPGEGVRSASSSCPFVPKHPVNSAGHGQPAQDGVVLDLKHTMTAARCFDRCWPGRRDVVNFR